MAKNLTYDTILGRLRKEDISQRQLKDIKSAIDTVAINIQKKGERIHTIKIEHNTKNGNNTITVSDVVKNPDDGWKIDSAKENAIYIIKIDSNNYSYEGLGMNYTDAAILEVKKVKNNSTIKSITQQLYGISRNIQKATLALQREWDVTNSVWGEWHEEETLRDDTILKYTGTIIVDSNDPSNPQLWNTSELDKVYYISGEEYKTIDSTEYPVTLLGKQKYYQQTIKFKEPNTTPYPTTIGLLFWTNYTQTLIVIQTDDGSKNVLYSHNTDELNTIIKYYHRSLRINDYNTDTKFHEFTPFSSNNGISLSDIISGNTVENNLTIFDANGKIVDSGISINNILHNTSTASAAEITALFN